jgi:hypothetical protein
MTKSSTRRPRRRGRGMRQRTVGAPQPRAEPPAEPSPAFVESEEAVELIRRRANEFVERQALEPESESGEQVAPGEIEEMQPARSGEDQTLCGD